MDYPNFGLTYFYKYEFPNGFDKWSKEDIFGPKKADHWDFYEGRFDLMCDFPVELADILDSIKNKSNEFEKITTPSNLDTLLAGQKKRKLKN